jgi:AmmeMemoRadiSam system protein A
MTLDASQRRRLLALARDSIERGLAGRDLPDCPDEAAGADLALVRASFATLTLAGELRGCCGSLQATRPLAADVWRNAWAAAFADPRFAPLARHEYPGIDLHISVLSPLEPLEAASEQQLLAALRPGTDGLVLELDAARATFLPAVWEQLPDAGDFVRHLKHKAGWAPRFWSPRIRAFRYTTESFGADR